MVDVAVFDGLVVTVVRVGDGGVEVVVAFDGAVVVDAGAEVVVGVDAVVVVGVSAGVVVVVADPARSVNMAVIEFGLGTDDPEGTKATVMSWPSASLMEPGSWRPTVRSTPAA